MKQRFSSLDLQVIAHELSTTITNYRLSNIYDITSRIFLLKFAKPESKHLLLIDSGFRCHLTTYSRGTASKQSSFVTRLRKCLRTRRCTKVQQIGTDRVLEFEFSAGEYRLYLEFYAGGNVVLVNKEGIIIAVLRDVKGGEGGVGECKVGAKYEVSTRTAEGGLRERITGALEESLKDDEGVAAQEATDIPHQGAGKKFKKKKKKKGEEVVKRILSSRMPEFSPTLIEHCFLVTGVNPDTKAEEALADDEKLNAIIAAFEEAEKMIKSIMADVGGNGIKGYIIAKAPRAQAEQTGGYKKDKKDKKDKKGVSFGADEAVESQPKPISFGTTEAIESEQPEKIQEDGEAKGMVYDDFFPFLPSQYLHASGVKAIECAGYNNTVDKFFSSIESQKSETRISTMKENAIKRLDAARTDHEKRVEGLRTLQEINTAKAQAIEANLERVEEVIMSVNGLIAQGMDWVAMGQLIDVEKKRGNAVAELIKLPLKLSENTVTIILEEPDFDEEFNDDDDSADETDPDDSESDSGATPQKPTKSTKTLDIDIDLSLTGYANASSYFTQKKVLLIKESKTIQSSNKALKSTEKKIQVSLKKALKQEKDILRPVRNQVWFEKFLFFISSDGYLVLGGRDLQQNEILYRRYFKRGDVYVSADVEGAATVVIKNNPATPNAPIPPSTLNQAGTLSVATSKAWDSKSVMSAWWVTYEQVGKTGGGGVYLDVGLFDIKGKKNFLPPAQLVLGYGVLWYVDEESRKRHGKHRFEEEAMKETVVQDEKAEAKGEDEADEADEEGEEEGEESDDEEFPDTQIEFAGEEKKEEIDESEDEEFPDAEVQDKDSEPEDEPAAPEANEEREDAAPPASDRADTPTGSKHMSAKERRELKKARATGGEPSTSNSSPAPKDLKNKEKPAPTKLESQQPAKVRGKKGKQKKLASKYAHQDEEDRALAMELLGSASARAKAEDAAATKAAKEAELAFQKARRKEQHARAAKEGLKAEEARRRENPDEEDEEDITTKIPLDSFIGTPMPGDNLLEAIPVCAPWGAMGKFKYKTKMQPGSVKKGKAVKDVVARWLIEGEKKMDMKSIDTEKMWPRENELIKGWKEAEIINCVGVSKVKVFGGSTTASGGKGGGGGKRGGRGSKKK